MRQRIKRIIGGAYTCISVRYGVGDGVDGAGRRHSV